MKVFDYERAWREVASPTVAALPQPILDLYARVVSEASNMTQDRACNLHWPETGLRAAFEAVDPDSLAVAARAIHDFGQWHPVTVTDRDPVLLGREVGATWRFSNLADQVLRARHHCQNVIMNGAGILICQGKARVCYASRNAWLWYEHDFATAQGIESAREAEAQVRRAYEDFPRSSHEARDEAAGALMAALEKERARFFRVDDYMIEETELALRREADKTDAQRQAERTAALEKFDARTTDKVAKLSAEARRLRWFVERGFDTDNVIYYDHTDTVAIGWLTRLSDAAMSTWLDILVEYPWPYELRGQTQTVGSRTGRGQAKPQQY